MSGFGKEKRKSAETERKTGHELLEKAIKLHQNGKIFEAEQLYLKAIKIGFHHEICFANLGVIFKRSNRRKEAKEMYKLAISVNPQLFDAHANLGSLLREEGILNQAIASTLRSLEIKPNNPIAHMNLGVIYKDLGKLDEALASTIKSLELKPDNADAHMNLGSIYKDLNELDRAISSTLRSLEIKPDNPIAHMNLGVFCKDLGKLDEALASTIKSLELKPDNPTAHLSLGAIYKDLGKLDEALAYTIKSLELKPDNADAHMNLGGIYKDLGKLDEALTSTIKSLELKPDNTDAYMNLGSIYRDLGKLDDAIAFSIKSLELNPDNAEAHMNLGLVNIELGNHDQGIANLSKATNSYKTKDMASITLAQEYLYLGRYMEAINTIKDVQTKAADNLLLSLYLCLGSKLKFNQLAAILIDKKGLNQRGIGAINHANALYSQTMDNGLITNTFDSILVQKIDKQDFPDSLIQEILVHLLDGSIQFRDQQLLDKGSQTCGNILDIPKRPFQVLKRLLLQKIYVYNKLHDGNNEHNFMIDWENNNYILRGWAIIMKRGGNLKSHNHELGLLTGTFYLQMPKRAPGSNEGSIEFSHQGPQYPGEDSLFERKLVRPETRDLNIFSSSLYHRTLPFQSEVERICIAFDLRKR